MQLYAAASSSMATAQTGNASYRHDNVTGAVHHTERGLHEKIELW